MLKSVMIDESLPMKPSLIYTEQFNVRVEKSLKDDIRFLSGAGVEVSELVRPLLRDAIKKAKRRIEDQLAG